MLEKEAPPQNDPLQIINRFYREYARDRELKRRTATAALICGSAGFFASLNSGDTKLIVASVILQSSLLGLHFLQNPARRIYKSIRHELVNKQKLQEATARLETEGEILKDDHTLDKFCTYSLARRARATKVFLAGRGKLAEYEEFNWLQTIPIPESLKPTHTELEEVARWEKEQDSQLVNFVDDLSRQQQVMIECGNEILPEGSKVYLFEDPRDPWKNRSQPLRDVMRILLARKTDLQPLSITNGLAFFRDRNHYEGVLSARGRQRITDFFGKPTYFYEGAELVHTKINRYGAMEDSEMVLNSLPEHLWRQSIRRTEPFSCITRVEPTAARLEKLGLSFTRA